MLLADVGSNPLTAEDAEGAEKKTAVNLFTLDGLETVGSIIFGATSHTGIKVIKTLRTQRSLRFNSAGSGVRSDTNQSCD
jgi:hypothetical protein